VESFADDPTRGLRRNVEERLIIALSQTDEAKCKASGEDGWSYLSLVGQYISNKTSFSPINYGYKKPGDLIRICDLFEIKMKHENSGMYIGSEETIWD